MAKIKLNGDTSGYIEISAPAVSGNNTLELGPGTKILTNLDNTFTGVSTFTSGLHITSGGFILNQQRSDTHTSLIIDKPDAGTGTLKFFNNGSASAYIQHTGAEHLHYYLPSGSGYHALYTNGTERLRITSDGKMGLGTQTPDATLKVNVASGNNGVVVQNTSTANIALFGARNGDATVQIGQWGSTASGSTFGLSNADLSFIYTTSYSTTHPSALALGTVSNKPIVFATNNTEKLRIDSSGRLMLGQTSAYAATGTGTMMLTVTKNGSNRTDVAISNQFSGDNASAAIVLATHGQDYILEATGSGNTTDGIRAFRILKGSDERLRITSDGHLVIGSGYADFQSAIRGEASSTDPYKLVFQNQYSNGHTDEKLKLYLFNSGNTRQGFGPGPNYDLQYHSSGGAADQAKHRFYTDNVLRMEINDAHGVVTKPTQPSFHATNTTIGQINTDAYGVIIWNDVTNYGNHNVGSHLNTSNGRFTAPVAGRYLICARTLTNSNANSNPYVAIHIRLNGVNIAYLGHNHTDNWIMESYSGVLSLSANDYVEVYVGQASAHGLQNYASFSGHLLS